jgi:hypothetical protein
MYKAKWIDNRINSSSAKDFATEQQAQEWLDEVIASGSIGLPARWLPDFLEGVESRAVIVREATEAYEETRKIYDENMNEIGSEVVIVPAQETDYYLEYLHPAEYTYEIIEEDMTIVKARKIKELSLECERKNPYLHGDLAYRVANVAMGKYLKEGKKSKEDQYKDDFFAVSNVLTTELERCTLLVNTATTEQEVIAVTFTL